MAKYTILKLTDKDYSLWDEFVVSCPSGKIFHTVKWLSMVSDHIDIIGVINDREELIGGVCLPVMKQGLIPRSFIPPLTPYLGPLFQVPSVSDTSKIRAVERMVYRLVISELKSKRNYDFILPSEQINLSEFIFAGFSINMSITYKFSGSVIEYYGNMAKNEKQALNKLNILINNGDLSISTVEDVDEVSGVFHDVFRSRIGLIHRIFKKEGIDKYWKGFYVKDKHGDVLSARLTIFDSKCGYALVTGSRRDTDGILSQTTLLTYDTCIRYYLEKGMSIDFCGSNIPGVANILTHLGGNPTPRYRVSRYKTAFHSIAKSIRDVNLKKRKQIKYEFKKK